MYTIKRVKKHKEQRGEYANMFRKTMIPNYYFDWLNH